MIKVLGSFTGIRIGIATIKAFLDSLNIPAIGVNSLETLAYSIRQEGFIASMIDCKNDNCYFALYQLKSSNYKEIISPTADTIENALATIAKQKALYPDFTITFVGDATSIYDNVIRAIFESCILAPSKNNLLNSYFLGLAGFDKFQEKKQEDILPLYLKKPQAQRQLEEKSKDIKILPMTFQDLEQISPILITDFDEFWSSSVLAEELKSENSTYLVAKLDDKIVGFAGIKVMLNQADIMNIVVKKDFRNQGIGTLLLKRLLDLAKENKISDITLEVMEENYSAIHLYKKFGFEQIAVRKNYYQDKNAIVMKK